MQKYEEMFPAFTDSRECKLVKVSAVGPGAQPGAHGAGGGGAFPPPLLPNLCMGTEPGVVTQS